MSAWGKMRLFGVGHQVLTCPGEIGFYPPLPSQLTHIPLPWLSYCPSLRRKHLMGPRGLLFRKDVIAWILISGQQSGTGLGDGEGDKATTEDLESEDIFDTAEKPGQKEEKNNEEEKPDTKEEQVLLTNRNLLKT